MVSVSPSTWERLQILYQWVLENGDKRTDGWLLVYGWFSHDVTSPPTIPPSAMMYGKRNVSIKSMAAAACIMGIYDYAKTIHSPLPVGGIFLCYLVIIWLGPKLMSYREPVNIKPLLLIYNFAMVCLSAYMFYEFTASWLANYSLLCQPVDYSENPLAMRMARWFYFSKVIELTDTMFFILRKKNTQLTFLHVYHHGTMIFNWWAGVKYVAGGQSFLIGLINPFVHVVMYMYYGLAALGPQMQK